MFIANRGEIAVRIARTARELGIATVVGVSEADRDSLAASSADETVVIGPAPARKSYLSTEAVLTAAREAGCDALHPGYGFLSENADFARAVAAAGLTWVGPSPESIELMGDKARARAAAKAAGVPTLAGSDGAVDKGEAARLGEEIGFPLVVKAAAGGGGRGIRLVRSADELAGAVQTASAEARAAFGDGSVYLERFVEHARHVEVQVLGDGATAIHLGDRDCSMQRRSQKVIEEAPAPDLPEEVRERIRTSAVQLAIDSGYSGAGTVEFLYDPARQEAAFIEMNTRLQVEHPVTEEITGIDLVAAQLRVADGEKLWLSQDDVTFDGHAIEVRVNAEDPSANFMPSPGTATTLAWPQGEGVRVDSGIAEGGVVAPFYDSMLAKVIVHAGDRDAAIAALATALETTDITGVRTTIPLLAHLATSQEFAAVEHDTTYIERVALPAFAETQNSHSSQSKETAE
nr:acetyl-CoA carboxylase biotin carboxylase subunit [Kineosphaera limosa]